MNDLEFLCFHQSLEAEANFLSSESRSHECRMLADKILTYFVADRERNLKELRHAVSGTFDEDKLFMGMQGNCIFYVPDPDSGYPDKPGGGNSEKN